AKMKRAPQGALRSFAKTIERLLDLALDELDVLLRDRIVLLHLQLLGHRPRVLLGDVIEPGVGARDELDLGGDGLGHDGPRNAMGLAGKLASGRRKSRKPASQRNSRTRLPLRTR